ncbi:MAG TPA: hypothetical protein PLC47_04580, partial [Bacteroidales bacterium]|nr:hypothetical protein [Bacteroidales bacterium]
MKKLSWILLFHFFSLTTQAQYYLSGEDPASVRWKQIQTEQFRIIFPHENESQAQQLASLLEKTYAASRLDLMSPAVKSDLILHTRSTISNASVAWAPRRLDFYNTPPQDGYAQDWFKQLAAHELRHVAQLQKLAAGTTGKVLNIVLGQQAIAALLGVFVPLWFMEGDAVVNETMLSHSGRGRDGIFLAKLKAQLMQKGYYVYDKAYFGSYKDFTPDIYELGYYLTAHNKVKYGPALWENALKRTTDNPWALTPFSAGIKKIAGQGKNRLYQETMFDLYEQWQHDKDTLGTPAEIISPQHKAYTSYRFPQMLPDGSILALRTAINDLSRLVKIEPKGKTTKWKLPGAIYQQSLSVGKSKVVWAELQPDMRWPNQSYAVIKIADSETGVTKQLTRRSKYFAPAISSNDSLIAAIQQETSGKSGLVILSAENGSILDQISIENYFLSLPKWHPNGKAVILIATGEQGKALFQFDLQTRQWHQLSPFTYTDILLTDVTVDQILFSGSFDESSQIFALSFTDKKLYQLTQLDFAAADAVWDHQNNALILANYQADGFRLERINKQDLLMQPVEWPLKGSFKIADELSLMRGLLIDTIPITDAGLPVKKYSKAANLFNLHSWSPVFIDVDNISLKPGISLFSQNSLSTLVAEAGYSFDLNEQTGKTSLGLQYRGWYPVVDFDFSHGLRRDIAQHPESGKLVDLKWNETTARLGLSLPLNFTHDKYLRGVQPFAGWEQLYRKMDPDIELQFKDNDFSLLNLQVFAYNQLRQSKRDIYPRWGQQLQLIFQHSMFDNILNQQFAMSASLYFPGILPHHGLRLYAARQLKHANSYNFSRIIRYPRGYTNLFPSDAFVAMLDYTLPVFYPDLVLPNFF